MQNFLKRNTCRLCKSRDLELIMNIASTPVGDDFIPENSLDKIQEEYPLELCFCKECGLLQVTGVINPELIYGEYLYETSISLGLQKHFKHYVSEVMRRIHPKKNSFVMDIGSNDGTLLKYFQESGMKVLGVEPAREIAKKVTASGVETIASFFSADFARSIKNERGCPAIVTANNIFANVDDCDDFITGVKELLDANSVFIFETGYMVDLIQNVVFDNIYHEHLCYFSIKPLEKFFNKNGLEMIDVERVATKGGSIRCTVQLKGGNRTVSPAVTELMTLETELGFDSITPFKIFVDRIESIKKKLTKMLLEIKAQGKTVVGYGASVGVTTMLYYFDLKNVLSFLVDDNPIKYNLYSPGHHIPVLPSETIYEQKPDYVLNLAWRYTVPIVQRHQKYLDQGGRIIVPLPAVDVIEPSQVGIAL